MDAIDGAIIYGVWLLLCIPVAVWAGRKGLNPWGYFFVSVILTPIVGGLAVAVAKPHGGKKLCPRCAEWVQGEAQVAEAIAAYGQLAPVCQQALWDAASNLIALFVFNRYPGCIRQATFLRSVADLTMRQNFQPASAPPSTEALKPAPPGGS